MKSAARSLPRAVAPDLRHSSSARIGAAPTPISLLASASAYASTAAHGAQGRAARSSQAVSQTASARRNTHRRSATAEIQCSASKSAGLVR